MTWIVTAIKYNVSEYSTERRELYFEQMTLEQKVEAARQLLAGTPYSMYKQPTTIGEYRVIINPLQSRMFALALGDQRVSVEIPRRRAS